MPVGDIYVVSIEDERWKVAAKHVKSIGYTPILISGVDVATVTASDLGNYRLPVVKMASKYTNGDVGEAMLRQVELTDLYRREKIAILRAMKHAVEVVGAGTIIQDDYRFFAKPIIEDVGDRFVTWAGDTFPGHYCPRAFTFPSRIGKLLINAWSDERYSACDGWLPIIRKHATEPVWR